MENLVGTIWKAESYIVNGSEEGDPYFVIEFISENECLFLNEAPKKSETKHSYKCDMTTHKAAVTSFKNVTFAFDEDTMFLKDPNDEIFELAKQEDYDIDVRDLRFKFRRSFDLENRKSRAVYSELNKSDKLDRIKDMALEFIADQYCSFFSGSPITYKEISEDTKMKLYKFDEAFEFQYFIALFTDWSVLCRTYDRSWAVMTTGIYSISFPFLGGRSDYIAYDEITDISIEENRIYIKTPETEFRYSYNSCNLESLKEFLEFMIKLRKKLPYEYIRGTTPGTSGKRNGITDSSRRKSEYERVARVSKIYEDKFRDQAKLFLANKELWKKNRAEYEKLLDEYEAKITELENEHDSDRAYIEKLQNELNALKNLRK